MFCEEINVKTMIFNIVIHKCYRYFSLLTILAGCLLAIAGVVEDLVHALYRAKDSAFAPCTMFMVCNMT